MALEIGSEDWDYFAMPLRTHCSRSIGVSEHEHSPVMHRVSIPSCARLSISDELPMRQHYSRFMLVRRLMMILLLFAEALGVVLADDPPKSQGQRNDGFLYLSPRIPPAVPGADPSPVVSSKRPPEKKRQSRSLRTGPLIGIIMDDLGYRRVEGLRAIDLPGSVTFSIIPHTPHARQLSELAYKLGKETLLHMPMESMADHYLEPGGLTTRMTRVQLIRGVHASIASLPHVKGINNHMGSLLTRRVKPMRWLMEAILQLDKGLYFVDSRTTVDTVAFMTAKRYGVPSLERDVFLDHKPNRNAIRAQLRRLIRKAKARGAALGIAHPYPETLDVLKRALPRLGERGVTLVSVSTLLAQQALEPVHRGQLSGGDGGKRAMEKDKPRPNPIPFDPTTMWSVREGNGAGDSAQWNLPELRIETRIEPRSDP
uniref:Uncharacterized conserved protein YibQ, putative polysaccharide deacetylase 2 family n=1 Tax=Candidatus Kentrum sp. TC TaxID=2126339 RepID=A0A450ZFR2_9GAMM|nr:MAG: Uncharacterized conserved protein YibQ, putative polysaccharide deacetylase 2 family [Candidatus Kentron sp. TC]